MDIKSKRASGILLHLTSLPSGAGIGGMGAEAIAFLDFLAEAGQSLWQILPVGPVDRALDGSPYCGVSAFAGNELLLDLEDLVDLGLLKPGDGTPSWTAPDAPVDWNLVFGRKGMLLDSAYSCFSKEDHTGCLWREFEEFRKRNWKWLGDYSLFCAIKAQRGGASWIDWPESLRERDPGALKEAARSLAQPMERVEFGQWLFYKQWATFRKAAMERGITLFGDLPLYVGLDSADVWSWQEGFDLEGDGRPATVAGVPPDYYSETGQRWGNPTYRWEAHLREGFSWWRSRVRHVLSLFDCVRLDHFRGLAAFWSIPAGEQTAIGGKWVEAPGADLLGRLAEDHPGLPVVAEDLGIITPDVERLKDRFGFPGMRVLQFGFAGDMASNPHSPHNFERGVVAYTGTHDNNTVRGWFEEELDANGRDLVSRYVGHPVSADTAAADLVRLALSSSASWAIFPLQDILGLDSRSRMNQPSTTRGNWTWRTLLPSPEVRLELAELVTLFGRKRMS